MFLAVNISDDKSYYKEIKILDAGSQAEHWQTDISFTGPVF